MGRLTLHSAVLSGQGSRVEEVLTCEPHFDQADVGGKTALLLIVQNGEEEIVLILLERGAMSTQCVA